MGIDPKAFREMQERVNRNMQSQGVKTAKVALIEGWHDIKHDKILSPTSSSKLKHNAGNEPLEKNSGKAGNSGCGAIRVKKVTIVSYRCRLLDKDNLYGGVKWWVDTLRYCGFISDDSSKEIELEVTQEKVKTAAEERTEITID